MLKRQDDRTRERERKRYEREARIAFGTGPLVQSVSHAYGDPIRQRQEAERLAARHDPTRPSACRLCAATVEPTTEALDGWKCCERCRALIPGGLAAVWSELLGETITRAELDVMTDRGVGNPSYVLLGWPTDAGHEHRWSHVGQPTVERARSVLDAVRAERSAATTPRPNTYTTGCCWCGVTTSTRWTETPWRFGRQGPRAAACADCEEWVARSGARSGHPWRDHLLAACADLRKPAMGLAEGFELHAFFEAGADPAGTPERWQYLGPIRAKLRERIIRTHPRLVELTATERRVRTLERTIAAVEFREEHPPLARL